MGVDCYINLPMDVDIDDIAHVMSILVGNKPILEPINGSQNGGIACHVKGYQFASTHTPHMTMINLELVGGGLMVDGTDHHYCHFFYCSRNEETGKIVNCLYPRSNPFWCALGKKLVQFFGGSVQFNDCDSAKGKNVYRSKRHCPVDKHGLTPHDGKEWNEYQKAMSEIKPLTIKDLEEVRHLTGYPDAGFAKNKVG